MPRTEEQNAALRKKRKAKILKGSLFLFASKGFDSSTIEDIAKASGMAHGLIYHYYPSKKELLDDLILSYGVKFEDDLNGLKGIDTTDVNAIDALIDFYMRSLSKADELAAYLKLSLESSYKVSDMDGLCWQRKAIDSVIGDANKADLFADIMASELDKRIALGQKRYVPFDAKLISFLFK